mmetsp:Transcript_96984/g.313328  ORF Transcript_96984/g.313328 Transcript_96984/m.313328 type:complete len:389 (+) Transcript_96984:222-1388(+)
MVSSGVPEMKRQPHKLEEPANLGVNRHGLLRTGLVLFLVVTPCPLQVVLVGHSRNREHEHQNVEGPQALRLDRLHDRMPRKARRDAGPHAEEEAHDQRNEHGHPCLLVDREPPLLRQTLGARGRLRRAEGAEDADGHEEVEVPQSPAVGEARQRLPVLIRPLRIQEDAGQDRVCGLASQVLPELRRRTLTSSISALPTGLGGPICVLRRDQLAHEQLLVAPHAGLFGVLEELEVLRGVGACSREQHFVAAGVALQEERQVVDLVVQDHVRLRAGRTSWWSLVLRDLSSREEGQLLAGCDLLEPRKAHFLRELGSPMLRGTGPSCTRGLDVFLRRPFQAPEFLLQLMDLLNFRIDGRLRSHLAHASLRPHEKLHPRAARKAAGDLVPHL